jgi:hypothetical protein
MLVILLTLMMVRYVLTREGVFNSLFIVKVKALAPLRIES